MADAVRGGGPSSRHAGAVEIMPLALPEPEEVFVRLESQPGVFWLDRRRPSPMAGRFSIMGCAPFARFRCEGQHYVFAREGRAIDSGSGDPWPALQRWLNTYRIEADAGWPVPFCGGAVGAMSYELGRIIEPTIGAVAVAAGVPDIALAWHDAAAVWDHVSGESYVVGVGWHRPPAEAIADLCGRMAADLPPAWPALPPAPGGTLTSNFTPESFVAAVQRVRERIAAGEIYQMNLAQCFRGALAEPVAQLYRRLRRLNPAPMAAFVDLGEGLTVLSSSPERFIAVERGTIRTFPIKGTRQRGTTDTEDAALKSALCASEKERAELLMIVDLMRNDLGRVCRFGSVDVRRLHALESFATVHHLVGEVAGELREDVGVTDLLRAVFPGGSIAGAPKVRAMQLIAEMEPEPRGLFSGAIGYIGADGSIDLNIAIRTIVRQGDNVSFHVGAGIVWDSDPLAEYEETLAKGRALFAALGAPFPGGRTAERKEILNGELVSTAGQATEPAGAVGVFETLRLRAGKPEFFADHVVRYRTGCAHFKLSPAPTPETLMAAVDMLVRENRLTEGVVRWSVWTDAADRGAQWRLRLEPPRPHMGKAALSATVSALRLPPPDDARGCKHLERVAWREALAAARAAGFDEVILLDQAGNVVEGGGSNVFWVDETGSLQTPPLIAGPLPGVTRAQVFALGRELGAIVREISSSPATLAAAREVFVTNALIGIRPLAAIDAIRLPAPGPVTTRLQQAWKARWE